MRAVEAWALTALLVVGLGFGVVGHAKAQAPAPAYSEPYTVALPTGAAPLFNDWNPVNDSFVVAESGLHAAAVINAATRTVVQVNLLKTGPFGVENVSNASSGQNEAWVSDSGATSLSTWTDQGFVSVVNLTTDSLTHTIPVGLGPERLCYASGLFAGGTVFVVNRGSDNVTVIGASNYTAWASVSTTSQPIGCLYDDDTATLFVSDYASNQVNFIGGKNLTDWTDTAGFNGPTVVAHSDSAHTAYVSDYNSGYVSAFSDGSRLILWSTSVGGHPYGIGFDDATAQVYAANIAGYVSVLSTSGALVTTIPTGSYTIGIHAYDPCDGYLLADNYGSDNVTFISDGTGGTCSVVVVVPIGASTVIGEAVVWAIVGGVAWAVVVAFVEGRKRRRHL